MLRGGRHRHLPGGDMQVLERGPRDASPIVLLHCYTCSISWWQRIIPLLDRDHRVVALDLRGFGIRKAGIRLLDGRPGDFATEALTRLGVHGATVVGQSLGGTVGTALSEVPGDFVRRLVIIPHAPGERFSKGLGFTAEMSTAPVIGPALWRV